PIERLFGSAVALHEGGAGPPGAHHFRRWRALARLHVRGGRGGAQSEGGARQGRFGRPVQRRQRREDHAQPGVGAAAKTGRRSHRARLGTAARGRCARFAGRHHAGGARSGPRPAVFVRGRNANHAGVVPSSPMTPALRVEFGLGLIDIGKPWGFANPLVPDERQARTLLERAFTLGVRYFDTAPSYGVSEERLGRFLGALTAGERGAGRIATKFRRHWDAAQAGTL